MSLSPYRPYRQSFLVIDCAKSSGQKAEWTINLDRNEYTNVTGMRLLGWRMRNVDVDSGSAVYPFYWLSISHVPQDTVCVSEHDSYPLFCTDSADQTTMLSADEQTTFLFNNERRSYRLGSLRLKLQRPDTPILAPGASDPRAGSGGIPGITELTLWFMVDQASTVSGGHVRPDPQGGLSSGALRKMEASLVEEGYEGPTMDDFRRQMRQARYDDQLQKK